MGGRLRERRAQWVNHSLVGDAPEHNVIQQGDLLGELHGRQRLETFCFRTFCLQNTRAHTHPHTYVELTIPNGCVQRARCKASTDRDMLLGSYWGRDWLH